MNTIEKVSIKASNLQKVFDYIDAISEPEYFITEDEKLLPNFSETYEIHIEPLAKLVLSKSENDAEEILINKSDLQKIFEFINDISEYIDIEDEDILNSLRNSYENFVEPLAKLAFA